MAVDTTLKLILLGDDRSASRTVKGLGNEVDKSSSKMDKFHKVGAAAGKGLAIGLLGAGAAALAMTKNAAQDQAAAAQLAHNLHAATGATKAQVAQTEAWITAQGKATGVSDEDLRPALSRLATATGSVTKSQKLAKLAMDISASTGKGMTQVSFALAKAQNGNVTALGKLGLKTSTTTKDTHALEVAQTGVKSSQLAYNAALKTYGKDSAQAHIAADKLKQAHENVATAQDKTKKTSMSLHDITESLTKQFGGSSAAAAQTAAGKQKILTTQIEELKEQIGSGLLPIMLKLVTVGISVINWVSHNTKTVGILVGAIGSLMAITWAVSTATKAYTAITKIARAGTILFTNAQWALKIAFASNPIGLIVVGLILLGAGLVLAYKKSETFRNIVNGAFQAVQRVAGTVFGWIKSHWQLLFVILTGPIGLATVLIVRNFDKIIAAIHAVGRFAVWLWNSAFQPAIHFIIVGLAAMLDMFGRVLSALGHVPGFGWAKTAGAALQSAADKARNLADQIHKIPTTHSVAVVINVVRGITYTTGGHTADEGGHGSRGGSGGGMSRAGSDPRLAYAKGGRDAGLLIIGGLADGIGRGWVKVDVALKRVTSYIAAQRDKLKNLMSARADFAGGFQSFASSLFGADYGQDADGNAITPNVSGILAYQKKQAAQAAALRGNVRKLVKLGLSPALLRQLQAGGAAGAAQIATLAAGASKGQIAELNAANADTAGALGAAGMSAGNAIYGNSIANTKNNIDLAQRIARELRNDSEHGKGEYVVVRVDGLEIIKAIRKTKRQQGQESSV